MNDFTYYSPTRFVFGQGMVDKTGAEMAAAGFKKVLLAYGKGSVVRTGVLDRVKASLAQAGIDARIRLLNLGAGIVPQGSVEELRTLQGIDSFAIARAARELSEDRK